MLVSKPPKRLSTMPLPRKAVDDVKNMVKWMCCNTAQTTLKQTYLLSKVKGTQEKDYQTLYNFLAAAGSPLFVSGWYFFAAA